MPETYRAPLRSRRDDVDPALTQERALTLGVVGFGGRLHPAPGPDPALADVLALTEAQHGERTARRVARFAAVPDGAVVWTRDPDGRFVRGVIGGAWRYDTCRDAYAADLVHVRPCVWDEPVDEAAVPAPVVATFERGGRNFQRIRALGDGGVAVPRRAGRGGLAARGLGLLAALALVAGCQVPQDTTVSPDRPDRAGRVERSATPAQASAPSSPSSSSATGDRSGDERLDTRPGAVVRLGLAEAVTALPVAPERRAGYDRDLFPHWTDADGNGCDTRDEVLITQNRARGARLGAGCVVLGGEWSSYYDRTTTTSASAFDIDHLVPLAEAWDSGAHRWAPARREAFANDLGDRRALIAVSASSNRTKSDADPAQWMPAYRSCVYVSSWVAVKVRWGLSVDPTERQALERYAAGCGERRVTVRVARLRGSAVADARPSDAGSLPVAAAPAPSGSSGGSGGSGASGAGGTDPRFDYCTTAIAAGYGPYVRGRDPEYAWYRDADGDGTVCES